MDQWRCVQNRFSFTCNFASLWCAENELISGDRFITVGWTVTVKPPFWGHSVETNYEVFQNSSLKGPFIDCILTFRFCYKYSRSFLLRLTTAQKFLTAKGWWPLERTNVMALMWLVHNTFSEIRLERLRSRCYIECWNISWTRNPWSVILEYQFIALKSLVWRCYWNFALLWILIWSMVSCCVNSFAELALCPFLQPCS